METVKANVDGLETVKDLKPLLTATAPCLSLYMPLVATAAGQAAKVNPLHWREIVSGLEKQAAEWGPEGKVLLESVSNLETLLGAAPVGGKSLVVLRSADVFRVCFLQGEVPRTAAFGPQFLIRPLLPELTTGKSFYLLALSQNNVRLLHCTLTSSEEIPIGKAAVTSFDAYMDSAKPDHDSPHGTSAGSNSGSARMVTGTTNTERETKEQYLHYFFKQVDRGVCEVLRGNAKPLIAAGVDYELALYKTVNSYPHLLEEGVHGAPNSLKSGEMHARAIQALGKAYEAKLDAVLAEYNHKVGGGASNRLKDVVTAAHDGRVLTLVISDNLITTGSFDEATNAVSGRAGEPVDDQDLVNDAAVQTILHAGSVMVASNSKMPHGSPVAAIFRY